MTLCTVYAVDGARLTAACGISSYFCLFSWMGWGGVLTFMYKFSHDRPADDRSSSHVVPQGYVWGEWGGVWQWQSCTSNFLHDRPAADMLLQWMWRQSVLPRSPKDMMIALLKLLERDVGWMPSFPKTN